MVSLAPLSDSHAPPVNTKRKVREDLESCSCYSRHRIYICLVFEYSLRLKSLSSL